MSKLTLKKSIEAKKLNPKTGVTLPGPEITIPFGAIIDNLEQDRDTAKFRYQMELYGCRYQVLSEAIDKAGIAGDDATPAGNGGAPAEAPGLQWERLSSSGPAVMRAKVPGGWLVSIGTGAAFYPDPMHAWDGTSIG